jgi:hypothetical protein
MYRDASDYPGNTPAVARKSHVDSHVMGLFERGVTVAPTHAAYSPSSSGSCSS